MSKNLGLFFTTVTMFVIPDSRRPWAAKYYGKTQEEYG
jgi:hypothetical protein